MRIATAPATMAGLLAPTLASTDVRASDASTASAPTEQTGSAFDAMLASLVGPSIASATPTPVVAESEQVVDADGAVEETEDESVVAESAEVPHDAGLDLATELATEPATDVTPTADAAAPSVMDGQSMESLHYGLRTDAQHTASHTAPHTPERASASATTDASPRATRGESHAGARSNAAPTTTGVDRAARVQEAQHAEPTETPATTPAATSTAAPSRDVEALAPELQTRLERVMDRMRDEFGHEVEIVETHRSQERQDALFAQGRTRPGPVVTWTRTSQHTGGLAVVGRIDGGWDDADAFATLQRVAREEGLKTLGPRDGGHLELPRGLARELATRTTVNMALGGAPAQPTRDASVADGAIGAASEHAPQQSTQVAPVATVAPVARVAQVATVAEVAATAATAPVAAPVAHAVRESADGTQPDAARTARAARNVRAGTTRTRRDEDARDENRGAQAAPLPTATAAAHAPRVAPIAAPMLGAAAVDRLTSVTDRMEAAAASRGVSHLTLRVDNALGGQDQIRIDLRGMTVDTEFAMGDAAMAERLGNNVGELRQALERQGLSADTVRISSAGARAAESASGAPTDASRVAAASSAQAGANAGDAGSASSNSSQSQQQQSRDAQQTLHRDAQQHGSRDGQRGHDAEPWLADEFTPRGRTTPRAHRAR
ncbi:MAG: hypothetical protein ACXW05_02770 [Gemmatirosa sp.]